MLQRRQVCSSNKRSMRHAGNEVQNANEAVLNAGTNEAKRGAEYVVVQVKIPMAGACASAYPAARCAAAKRVDGTTRFLCNVK